MTRFLHIDPDEFLLDSFRLGQKVYETGFRPKHVMSIWRGGTPVGLGVDEFFRHRGLLLNHTAVATESYTGVRTQGEVAVKGIEHVIEVVCPEDGLLIVDDVLESGSTIKRLVETIRARARANTPEDIRVATVHRKPDRTAFEGFFDKIPVITLKELPSDVWIDYPHELADLVQPGDSGDRLLRQKDEQIWSLLRGECEVRGEAPSPSGDGPLYLSARDLLLDSIRLGLRIVADESFRPDFLVALWPGGVNAGLPVHEVFKYAQKKGRGVRPPDHIALSAMRTRTTYRSEIIGIRYLVEHIEKQHSLLIVDTTFRSGQAVNDVLMKLKEALRRNLSLDRVRVAAVYYNPNDGSTWTVPRVFERPSYWVREVDREVIYPQSIHKLQGARSDLVLANPALHEILFGH